MIQITTDSITLIDAQNNRVTVTEEEIQLALALRGAFRVWEENKTTSGFKQLGDGRLPWQTPTPSEPPAQSTPVDTNEPTNTQTHKPTNPQMQDEESASSQTQEQARAKELAKIRAELMAPEYRYEGPGLYDYRDLTDAELDMLNEAQQEAYRQTRDEELRHKESLELVKKSASVSTPAQSTPVDTNEPTNPQTGNPTNPPDRKKEKTSALKGGFMGLVNSMLLTNNGTANSTPVDTDEPTTVSPNEPTEQQTSANSNRDEIIKALEEATKAGNYADVALYEQMLQEF